MKKMLNLVVTVLLSCSILSATGTVVTVANKAYLAQTSTAVATVYTPAATANLRVCVYGTETTPPTGGGTASAIVEWNDEGPYLQEAFVDANHSSSQGGSVSLCFPVHVPAGNPITVQASIGSGGVYDLFVTVEKLP